MPACVLLRMFTEIRSGVRASIEARRLERAGVHGRSPGIRAISSATARLSSFALAGDRARPRRAPRRGRSGRRADGVQRAHDVHARRAPSPAPARRPSPAGRRAAGSPCRRRRRRAGRCASTRIWPSLSASLRFVRFSDWARNGTVRKHDRPARRGVRVLERRSTLASGTRSRTLGGRLLGAAGVARADHHRHARRRRARTARPKPRAPVPPTIGIGWLAHGAGPYPTHEGG